MVLLLAALLALGASLCGCKFPSVLTQHIEDEQLGELDESVNPIYRDTPGAPESSTRTSSTISDSDRIDDQTPTLPVYEKGAPDNGPTDIREQRTDSANDDNASTGNRKSYAEGDNEVAGDSEKTGTATTGTDEGAGESPTDSTTTGEGEAGDIQNLSGGIGGAGETFDTTGTFFELPEGVKTVAAAGPYATLVQMLTGRGALVAADEEWILTAGKKKYFPGEGIEDLPHAWHGNAATGYTVDVETLVAAEPDVVLVDNVIVKLDDAAKTRLKIAGIDVIVLPRLGGADTPDADIVKAVTIIGQLLATADTQYDSQAMADEYILQHDNLLDACLENNGGYSYKLEYGASYQGIYQGTSDTGGETAMLSSTRFYTAFIDTWTYDVNPSSVGVRRYSNATLYLDGEIIDASDGAGLSAVTESRNFLILAYYLQVSGVIDNSYEGIKPASGGAGVAGKPYLVVPGGTRNLITKTTDASSRTAPSALWFSPTATAVASSWVTVGDESFPILLVRDVSIAQRVVASGNKVDGLYNVGQPYVVRVVPTGVSGSWADGTVESFLIASWIEGVFKNGGNLQRCASYVDTFYRTFYRCTSDGVLSDFDASFAVLGTVG